MVAPLYPGPSATRELPRNVLRSRVQQRVEERNAWGFRFPSAWTIAKFVCCDHIVSGASRFPPAAELDDVFPLKSVDFDKLRDPPPGRIQATWVGHATVLVQTGGCNILADPIFSERCSAVQWAGPKRFRRPAFTVPDLVREGIDVHAVLVSHNHYDHLDYRSCRDLAALGSVNFIVPLGLRTWFKKWIPDSLSKCTVTELDWHEGTKVGGDEGVKITAVPMSHWSNRTGDRDQTLWCGYSICDQVSAKGTVNGARSTRRSNKFLFVGDTGWFDQLEDVGRRYGPFDMAAIPIGAYEPRSFMASQHINPEEAVSLFGAVRANKALSIHWGTFDLTLEDAMEPRERLAAAMTDQGYDPNAFPALYVGETLLSERIASS